MTSPITKSSKFWNRFARRYSKNAISDPAAYEFKLGKTRAHLTPESHVLEFGCGTGSTALLHAPQVAQLLAIDYAENMIRIAQEKAQMQGVSNVEFLCGTLSDLKHPPKSFDVILGLNVLHLMEDIHAPVQKCYGLLKPGGVLITSTACMGKKRLLKAVIAVGSGMGVIPYVNFLSTETLTGTFTRAGFAILEYSTPGKDKNVVFVVAKKPG